MFIAQQIFAETLISVAYTRGGEVRDLCPGHAYAEDVVIAYISGFSCHANIYIYYIYNNSDNCAIKNVESGKVCHILRLYLLCNAPEPTANKKYEQKESRREERNSLILECDREHGVGHLGSGFASADDTHQLNRYLNFKPTARLTDVDSRIQTLGITYRLNVIYLCVHQWQRTQEGKQCENTILTSTKHLFALNSRVISERIQQTHQTPISVK